MAGDAAFRLLEGGRRDLLLTCDHASRVLPEGYGTLGIGEAELARHIGWDIGAAALTEALVERLDAPAVLSGFSRLLVDCNRAPDDPTLICELSDGTVIAGNRGLSSDEVAGRIARFHTPYHDAIARQIDVMRRSVEAPAIVSIHSFTPTMRGRARPWHCGILWDQDPRLAVPLMAKLGAEPGLEVGDNHPYSGKSHVGYTMGRHGASAGLPHVLIEVRQDEIDRPAGVERWAGRLARVLAEIMAEATPFRVERY
ncbi:N-formylglutamate amidohydrolase [Desertibaculum subflavum]|uniref:N-formylglutamate amidohydrolase n=1 Tax=Desertibaculum subflavum TaxID=2268458 RepID=UPI000E67672F